MKSAAPDGLAAWLLARFGSGMRIRFQRANDDRRMRLVETLSLGGNRRMMLVICDGQRFLVGASGDGVETIVAMGAQGTTGLGARPKASDGGH